LSGLSQIQNGFQNLLENGFEKLEKEKEKENPFHSDFGPLLFVAQRTRPAAFPRVRLGLPACGPLSPSPAPRVPL
jgi:hypothetical protein